MAEPNPKTASVHLHRIIAFWNWLPAFRVVAETEHLPSASEILGVSASSLSRMIKLLEEHLGYELFIRTGRGIELTREGRVLLRSVRTSMRTVDDGLTAVKDLDTSGELTVSSVGLATRAYVVPAVLDLRKEYPGIVPILKGLKNEEAGNALLKGAIDVAFTEQPIVDSELAIESLSRETHSIYCGVGHPLYKKADVSLEEACQHPFCAPVRDGTHASADGWPVEVQRQVVLFAREMHVGFRCCESGELQAVLPDAVAAQSSRELWRVPVDIIPPTSLYAVTRKATSEGVRPEALLVGAVQAQIAQASALIKKI